MATGLGVQSIMTAECTRRPGSIGHIRRRAARRRPGPYPSGLMAEFQWWLLLVGLVAGGVLVAIVAMDGRRREEDLAELERQAEATWIADRLSARDRALDPDLVESVLRVHREYLSLPPPDRLLVDGDVAGPGGLRDGDADRDPDEVRDDRGGRPDEDLSRAREQEASAGQQAHARADGEQGGH
jgi:hypothetical protein